jgi:hypothetical protein
MIRSDYDQIQNVVKEIVLKLVDFYVHCDINNTLFTPL